MWTNLSEIGLSRPGFSPNPENPFILGFLSSGMVPCLIDWLVDDPVASLWGSMVPPFVHKGAKAAWFEAFEKAFIRLVYQPLFVLVPCHQVILANTDEAPWKIYYYAPSLSCTFASLASSLAALATI
jgi:hypothetical protein